MPDAPGDSAIGLAISEEPPQSLETALMSSVQPLGLEHALTTDTETQIARERQHEHQIEEEREKEREDYIDESRFLALGEVNILSAEAYKRLFKYDKARAKRLRARQQEWLSGILARKERAERRDALFQARLVCRRARYIALKLAEKLIRVETEAKVRRFEKWQRAQRKVEIWHDRFDSRIAGYTPDQKERLERYRESLERRSRFAYAREKQREAERRKEALSRFEAANRPAAPHQAPKSVNEKNT